VGKTRLALAIAGQVGPGHRDGAVFVDLAPLRDPRLVPATIARALDLRESGGRSARDLLVDHLHERQVLLVLDNFEHLLPAAPLLAELLQQCPRLALLVTSRAALRLRGEQRFPVPPLPAAEPEQSPEEIAASPAAQLFVARAQTLAPDFGLDPHNAEAIAAICRRLDGLPLAIELAAARVGLLGAAALLRRLEHRLPLLTGGSIDLPERQQTLRQTLAWSHDLLGPGEQVLFRRLAVFAGGWTAAAAEAICADAELPAASALDSLQVLVDSSLIQVRQLDDATGEPRFALLETIREYALERLEAAGETGAVARRHLAWYMALAESVPPDRPDAQQLRHLVQEQDNLHAALRWSVQAGEAELALRLGAGLHPLWYTRGLFAEGQTWLAEVLALPGAAAPTAARALALALAGQLAECQGHLAEAEALLLDALAIAQQTGDGFAQTFCWHCLANVARERGALDEAAALYRRARAAARSAGSVGVEAWATTLTAMVHYELQDAEEVRRILAEAAHLDATCSDPRLQTRILSLRAWLAMRDGDPLLARALEEHSLAVAHAVRDVRGLMSSHWIAALNALDGEQRPAAARHLLSSLTIAQQQRGQHSLARGLEGVAELVAPTQPQQAVQLVGAATALRDQHGLGLTPLDHARLAGWSAGVRLRLGEAGYAAAWADGRRALLEHVITRALDLAAAADVASG
jgi:predicted ATPase